MEEKRDSAQYTNIYASFLAQAKLLPDHREQLKNKRGFTDETIDALQFKSCHKENIEIIKALSTQYGDDKMIESGLVVPGGPNPKLLSDNTLIPFLDHSKAPPIPTYLKPHKDALHGFQMPVYCPTLPKASVILTESEFKAVAAWQLGHSAIGIGGVSACIGKNYPMLLALLKANNVTFITIIFDNEIKDNPAFPNYKKHFWDRFDTQFYAYSMAIKLISDGIKTNVATLPPGWMVDGKIDLDGALAQGKSRIELGAVLRGQKPPEDYLKTLHPDAKILIERRLARTTQQFPIRETDRRYWVQTKSKDGTITFNPITNFTMRVENSIYDANKKCRREITLANNVGESAVRTIFEEDHVSHFTSFREHCRGLGNYLFTGTQTHLDQIIECESAREIGKRVYQPDHVGWIEAANCFIFANGGVAPNGARLEADDEGIVWLGLSGFQAIELQQGEVSRSGVPRLHPEDMDPETLFDEIDENFGGMEKTGGGARLACSWLVASLLSHWICKQFEAPFPLLFICGQQGSAKTTLCRWLSAMAGQITDGYSYWYGTLVGMQRGAGYYSSQPMWLDEYRNSSESKYREREGFFRSAYDRQAGLKGVRQSFGVRGGAIRARMLVSGQDTPGDVALQQRCITIRMKQKDITNSHYEALQAKMGKMSGIIPVVVKRFYDNRAKVWASIAQIRDYMTLKNLDSRTSLLYGILLGVYDSIIRPDDKRFLEVCVDHAEQNSVQKEAEKPYRQLLAGIQEMRNRKFMNDGIKPTGGHLAIYFDSVLGAFKQMVRQQGGEFPFKPKTLLDEFEEQDCFVERERWVKIDGQEVKCLILDPAEDDRVDKLYRAAAEG